MQIKKSTFLVLFLITSVLFIQVSCKKNSEVKKVIGDTYQGGKVFFVDDSGLHGLVAAAADVSMGTKWGCKGTTLTGADGTNNGTGNQNTMDIISSCTQADIAAKLCSDLTSGGFSDWYLPSKDELNLMFQQKAVIGGFNPDQYWSSSEYNADRAWIQDFNTGTQYHTTDKSWDGSVRAIRSF